MPLPTYREPTFMELRDRIKELERENAKLRETLELALHVRGTSEDTPEVAAKMETALGR